MRILIVEPDNVLRAIYAKIFLSSGYEVNSVSGAQGALNSINDNIPDVILMDIEIPKNSGFELIYEIRSYSDLDKSKIYIISMVREEHLIKRFGNFKKDLMISKIFYKPDISANKLVSQII